MKHDSPPSPTPDVDELNLDDPRVAIDLLTRAAALNRSHPAREGMSLRLPQQGCLLMTGDLHDDDLNFRRIVKLAALHQAEDRHLVLHELIHGPRRPDGRDLSVKTLLKAAALKCAYPLRVHLILGNHELAQWQGESIIKDNVSSVEAFDAGLQFLYADQAMAVQKAVYDMIQSMLLAVRCPNGIFCSHSLPSPRQWKNFDPRVIERELTEQDLASGGSAYQMVWGRRHNQTLANQLAKAWDATLFVMGHQPAEMGYETVGSNLLILASDHGHGMVLPLQLQQTYDLDTLVEQLVPLASIAL